MKVGQARTEGRTDIGHIDKHDEARADMRGNTKL
jgi:hypothetical protein